MPPGQIRDHCSIMIPKALRPTMANDVRTFTHRGPHNGTANRWKNARRLRVEYRYRRWEAIAMEFVAARSTIGSDVVRQWAKNLRPGSDVVDIGCGSGAPVSQVLVDEGCCIFGIDASPTLLSMFKRRFPAAPAACEPVERSLFFSQKFDGAVAVGLLFLLPEEAQRSLIKKVGTILKPDGRFLFSAPQDPCEWPDRQTGQVSRSLGMATYERLLRDAGLRLERCYFDEGGNHYVAAVAEGT